MQKFGIGHGLAGHSPDYIGNYPGKYGAYVDQLYSTLTSIQGGGQPHPEWIDELKDTANSLPASGFLDFFSTKNRNRDEVNALMDLDGGYGESAHDFNPDSPIKVLNDKKLTADDLKEILDKIRNGVAGCCLEK